MTANIKEQYRYMACLAERLQRFQEMNEAMIALVTVDPKISRQQRNLLAAAFKNVIFPRRFILIKPLNYLSWKAEQKGDIIQLALVNAYKAKIQTQLRHYCEQLFTLIDKYLLPNTSNGEEKVFYLKLKGDTFRYIQEFAKGSQLRNCIERTHEAYRLATELAKSHCQPLSPIKLELALNYSNFLYQKKENMWGAYQLAKQAYDNAIKSNQQSDDEDDVRVGKIFLNLLKDCVAMWEKELIQQLPNDD